MKRLLRAVAAALTLAWMAACSGAGALTTAPPATLRDSEITLSEAVNFRHSLAANLGDGLEFTAAGYSTFLDTATILGLVTIEAGADGSGLHADVDQEALTIALSGLFADVYSVPHDGLPGLTIDWTGSAAAVADVLAGAAAGPVELTVRTWTSGNPLGYTFDMSGLAEEIADHFEWRPYAVAVVDLTDQGRDFAANADQAFITASTYKLFVAYSMVAAVDAGTWAWDSWLNGTTLEECMYAMIVWSDNDCPEAWIALNGVNLITDQAAVNGATNTIVTFDTLQTTAADLAAMLVHFYRHDTMSEAGAERVIALMQAQIYRSGIPAGLGDSAVVADKVGFLDSLLHDAGIVYSDHGDYVLVVLTEYATWEDIAWVAQAVDARMR